MQDEEKSKRELIRELEELRCRLAAGQDPQGAEPATGTHELAVTVSLLEATLESTADGILVVDAKGRQVAVNDVFKSMWGFGKEEVVSLDNEEALAFVLDQLKDPDGFLDKVRILYARPKEESFDTLDFKDGRCFERYSRPRLVSGLPRGRVWSFRDVTQRVRIERDLRESRQRLDLVMNAIPAFISYVDAEQRYQVVNEHYERGFGIQRQEIVGKTVAELVGWQTHRKMWPYVDKALKGHEQQYEVTMELANLGPRTLSVHYVPDFGADSRVKGYYTLATDITDNKQAEEELRDYRDHLEERVRERTAQLESARDEAQKANRAKRDFLARMSHEIRTPLNGVIGLSRLLMKSELPRRELEYARNLASSAHVLLHLVNEILDFSKIEAGKVVLNDESFHVGRLLDETRELLAPLAAEKGLRLHVTTGGELEWHVGDQARIRQVLVNLVGNAIKFTGEGRVEVSAAEASRSDGHVQVRFAVRDTGPGIPEENRSRIFRHFERTGSSDSQELEGTGLGLAICKALVELMGGEIGVDSAEATGSIFFFTLPLKPGQRRAEEEAAPFPMGRATSAGTRILIAEDNPVNQLVTRRVLEDLGYQVDVVGNGREALEALKQGEYALVLMDCRMPELDGYEAARRIRQDEIGGAGLPIVALTANAVKEDLDRCLEVGMNDYLSKPFSEDDLEGVLSRWICGCRV